jgi:hypothetical protein
MLSGNCALETVLIALRWACKSFGLDALLGWLLSGTLLWGYSLEMIGLFTLMFLLL